jgi:hypothetical protein
MLMLLLLVVGVVVGLLLMLLLLLVVVVAVVGLLLMLLLLLLVVVGLLLMLLLLLQDVQHHNMGCPSFSPCCCSGHQLQAQQVLQEVAEPRQHTRQLQVMLQQGCVLAQGAAEALCGQVQQVVPVPGTKGGGSSCSGCLC